MNRKFKMKSIRVHRKFKIKSLRVNGTSTCSKAKQLCEDPEGGVIWGRIDTNAYFTDKNA